jgi:hypothetical protein
LIEFLTKMNAPLTPEQLANLRCLDASTLANAIETFHDRLRNEGFVDHTVRCLFPRLQPMLGYAATVKIRGSAPPTGSGPYRDRTDWWDYIVGLPAPRVVVIQDIATRPGLGSLVGAVHMNILRALHCVGVVTNGVQSIPLPLAACIPEVVTRIRAKEQALIALCRSPEFSIEKLRRAVGDEKL